MQKRQLSLFVFFFLLVTQSPALFADTIVLKDGSKEESERIWESDGYVHFILNGTRSVEIRYSKEIVERIERKDSITPEKNKLNSTKAQELQNNLKIPNTNKTTGIHARPSVKRRSFEKHITENRLIKVNRGIQFYDPHRPKRYWVDVNAKFLSLNRALNAFAELYSRSPEWVAQHMGEENDLGRIHFNLMRQYDTEDTSGFVDGSYKPIEEKIRKEQEKVFTKESVDEMNDSENRVKLKNYLLFDKPSHNDGGTRFYDPRRKEKYWTGPLKRYNSLSQAISSLAEQYGVSIEWIEANMGDTNQLDEIHRNIKKNLKNKNLN